MTTSCPASPSCSATCRRAWSTPRRPSLHSPDAAPAHPPGDLARLGGMSRWSDSDAPRGAAYDQRFERLAAAGHDIHGEASFVAGYEPGTVLDAGCGTGRVAIELARRGIRTVGIDLDP